MLSTWREISPRPQLPSKRNFLIRASSHSNLLSADVAVAHVTVTDVTWMQILVCIKNVSWWYTPNQKIASQFRFIIGNTLFGMMFIITPFHGWLLGWFVALGLPQSVPNTQNKNDSVFIPVPLSDSILCKKRRAGLVYNSYSRLPIGSWMGEACMKINNQWEFGTSPIIQWVCIIYGWCYISWNIHNVYIQYDHNKYNLLVTADHVSWRFWSFRCRGTLQVAPAQPSTPWITRSQKP